MILRISAWASLIPVKGGIWGGVAAYSLGNLASDSRHFMTVIGGFYVTAHAVTNRSYLHTSQRHVNTLGNYTMGNATWVFSAHGQWGRWVHNRTRWNGSELNNVKHHASWIITPPADNVAYTQKQADSDGKNILTGKRDCDFETYEWHKVHRPCAWGNVPVSV